MIKKIWYISLFLLLGILQSCGDDNDPLPSYRQDLAELQTDASGKASSLLLDDGRIYRILNNVSGLVPDTLFRIQAMYIEQSHEEITLESARVIVSPLPVDIDGVEMHTDPVDLKAMWGSRRYVNLLVGARSGGGKQVFGFVDSGIKENENGSLTLNIVLYHHQSNDPLFYTRDIYMSCPIYQYQDELESDKDSVAITVKTFDGIQRKSFLYMN